jgi:UDP-N-acetyl-D-mannosaminuronic acid dehydrogenase
MSGTAARDHPDTGFTTDVVIVGGCGRVGLPLGLALASRGQSVVLYDLDAGAVEQVNAARMPFVEPGADGVLRDAARAGLLRASTSAASVARAETVIVVIGTPVDEHLNPDLGVVPRALDRCAEHLHDGQLIVLRSTVHPGVTALTARQLAARGLAVDVAFCPERIAEGKAMQELFSLPQIVAGTTPRAAERAEKLFGHLTDRIVTVSVAEAELAKLFTNTWRYLKFATANQFWMMANDAGVDYARVQHAITLDYPRAADLPMPGFAAGPCLLKDTMQLAAFNKNNFVLGHAAMLINEGLPLYLVSRLESRFDLSTMTVGILGMAFKGDSDDPRESLAFKLRKILQLKAEQVLCTDPQVRDDRLVPLDTVLEQADLLVIAAPHRDYAALDTATPVVDIWGLTGNGVRA